jgi:hypothetical protein
MNLLSKLIFNLCMVTVDQNCVERLHVCMRDNFQVNFYDDLTWQRELVLPVQLQWCQENGN